MMSSHRWKVLCALPLVGALAGVLGCMADVGASKSPEATEGAAQAITRDGDGADEAAAASPQAMRPPPPPGGPELILMAALHEISLTDAQRSAIQGALEKAMPPPPDRGASDRGGPDRGVFTAIAAGVRAGKLDANAIAATLPEGDRGPEAHLSAIAGAIDALHATLTKEQRRALVEAIESHAPDHSPPPPMKGDRGPGGGPAPGGGPLGHLLSGLGLSDGQRASIEAALAANRPAEDDAAMRAHFEAFHAEMQRRLETFAADSFDAKAFVAPPEGAPRMGPKQHVEGLVKDLSAVVPVLTGEQREALASLLEKGPPAPPPGAPPPAQRQ